MTKRWAHKCARCNHPIMLGKEVWYLGEPYGEYCYKIIQNMEIRIKELDLRQMKLELSESEG